MKKLLKPFFFGERDEVNRCTLSAWGFLLTVRSQDPSKPVIMAGMGTGLAPWRAVTQASKSEPMGFSEGLVLYVIVLMFFFFFTVVVALVFFAFWRLSSDLVGF